MPHEQWKRIRGFRKYEVSDFGRVANIATDVLIQPSLTLQGALKVGLYKDGIQHTRSLKVLVAEAFVPGSTKLFDTPILLDGDQCNCVATNMMWRPRWFAWNYSRQFRHIPEHYRMGPLVEIDANGIVIGAYMDTIEVGETYGLLFSDIWQDLHIRNGIYPTRQYFAFANKV